jgi:hypothetical protein
LTFLKRDGQEAGMKLSSIWTRRALIWSAAGALAIASIVATTAADAAHTTAGSRSAAPASKGGIGYGTPKGIYAPFTDCAVINPLMAEASPSGAVGCVVGDVMTGSIKIGNVTTKIRASAKVKYPVTVQFGFWSPQGAAPDEFSGGVLPPPEGGLSAQLISSPQYVRGGLLKALGCATNTNATVAALCTEAQKKGGKYLKVFAAAQSAGPIMNFNVLDWEQPVMFHLINPLLGVSCYIGSADNPVVLNPTLNLTNATGTPEPDPRPRYHPDTEVLAITNATATDTTFTASGVTGCGPGGAANIAVDAAIDGAVGLPTASGADSITLTGNFYLAATTAPNNKAKILLSAFRASARSNGADVIRRISGADLRHWLLEHLGS